jgi:signal transduction histidine kinase
VRKWKIAVKDNGPGIPDKYRNDIFASFERLHGKEIAGSGIGLALYRRIVETHGEALACSLPPVVSRFLFSLSAS